MRAIISSTYHDNYLFFLPIVTWCWNKLGVDVMCFMPYLNTSDENKRIDLINDTFRGLEVKPQYAGFAAPKHKEATYSQCSRLYAACLDLPEDEILITSDVDMAVFSGVEKFIKNTDEYFGGMMSVVGKDLVPDGQIPMCYTTGSVKDWRKAYRYIYGGGYYDDKYKVKAYQEYLDDLLGGIETDNFRGNYWCKDQDELYNIFRKTPHAEYSRARPGTQFASNRVDRDDINWRHYVNDGLVDAHLWRPGYTDENFANILELLQMKYPNDNFDWLIEYRENYVKLL